MNTIKMTLLGLSLCLGGLSLQAQNKPSEGNGSSTRMVMAPAMPEDISPLLVGEKVPAMQLPDANGTMQNVNALIKAKPTILVFYRGGWCPYCTKQLSGLQEARESLEKMGYQLLAISTDSPEKLSETMGKQTLDYTLLSDADLNVTRAFGIAFQAPEDIIIFYLRVPVEKIPRCYCPFPPSLSSTGTELSCLNTSIPISNKGSVPIC